MRANFDTLAKAIMIVIGMGIAISEGGLLFDDASFDDLPINGRYLLIYAAVCAAGFISSRYQALVAHGAIKPSWWNFNARLLQFAPWFSDLFYYLACGVGCGCLVNGLRYRSGAYVIFGLGYLVFFAGYQSGVKAARQAS